MAMNIPINNNEVLTDADILTKLCDEFKIASNANPADFKQITMLSREIDRVQTRIAKNAPKSVADDAPTDDQRDAAVAEIKKKMRAELKRRDFYYVTANEKFWLKTHDDEWIPVSERGLTRDIPDAAGGMERGILYEVMKEDGRWYDRCTYTFDKVDRFTLNMLVRDFVVPVDGEPHWFFDAVVAGLGGERGENVDHIEKLVLTKYLHPESVTIPALLLQDRGGTGKGLFTSRILPAIFGNHGVARNLKVAQVTGQFNAVGRGKAVWFLNEASRGSYSHAALKGLVGSETYSIEHKGVDPIEGQMTAWIIMSTQDADGAVMLEGGGADRRWSVVRGNRELVDIVAERQGWTVAETKAWIDTEGKEILSDRAEAGKWVNALIERHGDVRISQGLHGADYDAIRGIQRSIDELLFREVFDAEDFAMIRSTTLYDAYCHFARGTGRMAMGRGKFHAAAAKFLEEHHPEFAGRVAVNLSTDRGRSKIEIYCAVRPDGTIRDDNDHAYRERGDHGRTEWIIAI